MADNTEDPVVKFANQLLVEGVKRRSSDIFIEPEEKNIRVRYRVDGLLQEGAYTTNALHGGVFSRIKVMARLDIAEKRLPQDGRISLTLGGRGVDVRVSTLPSRHGERVVMRILDKDQSLRTLDGLGMAPATLARFQSAMAAPNERCTLSID